MLLRAVLEHKFLVGLMVLLGGGAAAIVAWNTVSIYRASVVVTESDGEKMGGAAALLGQFGGLANLAGLNLGVEGSSREAKALLKSNRLVEEFIRRNNLLPVIFPDAKSTPTLWFAVKRFKSGVFSVREDIRAGVTTITIDWRDPEVAASWANDIVALANDIIRTRAVEESTRNVAYLNKQIAATDVIELQRVMYQLVESETKTLMLANARAEYAFTIVDPAVPPELRISPRRTLMLFFGLVLGFFAGVAIVFLRCLRAGAQAS